jgi:hypothetical protein
LRRINFQLKKMLMKGKQRPSRPRKIARKAGSEEGRQSDGRPSQKGADGPAGGGENVPTTADFTPIASGKAPTIAVMAPMNDEEEDQRNIHNGSAGAFEAAEGGREDEDSDEDNDDLATGH